MLCVIFVIPLHCQNETRVLIKNKTNMKTLELKDLKAGKYYKEVYGNYVIYVEILSEGIQGLCNYLYLSYEKDELMRFEVKKRYILRGIERTNEKYIPCAEKEFKKAIETIKNSLTF